MVKCATLCTPQPGCHQVGRHQVPTVLVNREQQSWDEKELPRAGFGYPQLSAEAPTASRGKELTLPPFLTVLFNTLLTLKSRHVTSQRPTSIRGKTEARRDTQSVELRAPPSYGYVTAHKLLSQTRLPPPFGAKPTRLLFAFNAAVNP